jgi:O-antigen/teichoic acid export membrane protein
VSDPAAGPGAAHEAGHRAARNTAVLMVSEIVGRLAWFAVFAGLGRTQGEAEVGIFVFAAALVQIAMLGVDLGLDRHLIRTVAKERDERHNFLSDIVSLKLVLALPMAILLAVLANVLGYGGETAQTIYVLTLAFVLEGLGRTVFAVLTAFEEGGAIAVTAVVQRLSAAALGLVALVLGYGVVVVAVCYLIGAGIGLALATVMMVRTVGRPRWSPDRTRWLGHAKTSLPFATEDVFMVLLFKVDAVILALMTTEVAVGLYGAAYRVFEATLVVPYALVRAFSAMYVYLERDTEPTIQGTFSRSIKLALAALLPISVIAGLLAEPILTATFGDDFTEAAGPLRLLAPAIAMLGIVSLSNAVITSRRDPKIVMYLTAVIAAINVGLNLVLIPPHEASGAAAAMLISETLFSVAALTIAVRTVGGVEWIRMLAGPVLAAAVMAAAILPLAGTPLLAIAAGLGAYLIALYLVERVVSPGDVRFAADLFRRYLPGRAPA